MKKIFFGIIIGMTLMIPVQSFANSMISMIGKKVDGVFSLKINTNETNKKVIDIDGTSYLSVRDAAELFGYNLIFNDTKKEVDMLSRDLQPPENQVIPEYHTKTVTK